jgi:7-cyano-7-deazaguanine synthase in queuosine biosynthesis
MDDYLRGGAQVKWTAELMYVRRDSHGVIVGVQQEKPSDYADNVRKAVELSSRASSNEQEKERIKKIEQQIREYALKKKKVAR